MCVCLLWDSHTQTFSAIKIEQKHTTTAEIESFDAALINESIRPKMNFSAEYIFQSFMHQRWKVDSELMDMKTQTIIFGPPMIFIFISIRMRDGKLLKKDIKNTFPLRFNEFIIEIIYIPFRIIYEWFASID